MLDDHSNSSLPPNGGGYNRPPRRRLMGNIADPAGHDSPSGPMTVEVCQRGWDTYHRLRRIRATDPQNLAPTDTAQIIRTAIRSVMPSISRPDGCFSMLLVELNFMARHFPWFPGMLEEAGELRFRPEDFQRYRPQGGPENGYDSLVEKLIRTVYKTAKEISRAPGSGVLAPRIEAGVSLQSAMKDYFQWAADFVSTYASQFPAQEWFPYYQGRLQIMAGRGESARAGICNTVRNHLNAFWAWENMARTCDDDQRLQTAFLCKAVSCAGTPPEYLVNTRAWLGKLLLDAGRIKEAKTEIEAVLSIRNQQNWTIPPEIREMTEYPGYAATTAAPDNTPLYREYVPLAENALWNECGVPVCIGVVVQINAEAGKTRVALGSDQQCNVRHDRHTLVAEMQPGEMVALRTERYKHPEYGEITRVLTVEAAGDREPETGWIRQYQESLRVKEAGYGFAGDVFVPPPLIRETEACDGDMVSGMAILERNAKRREPGWKAVTLRKG